MKKTYCVHTVKHTSTHVLCWSHLLLHSQCPWKHWSLQ